MSSSAYWANKWHINMHISKAASINFTSTYWNAKGIGRWIDSLIDFTGDWQARSMNPFCVSSEKETKLIFGSSARKQDSAAYNTFQIPLHPTFASLIQANYWWWLNILNENGVNVCRSHKSVQQTVMYTTQFMHKCFWVNTSSAKLFGINLLCRTFPAFFVLKKNLRIWL